MNLWKIFKIFLIILFSIFFIGIVHGALTHSLTLSAIFWTAVSAAGALTAIHDLYYSLKE